MIEIIAPTKIEMQIPEGHEFHPDLVDEGIVDAIQYAPVYQKFAYVQIRFAEKEEVFETYVEGKLETRKIVKVGGPIVLNPGGEEYPTEISTFAKRYNPDLQNPGWYFSKGKVRAIRNPWSKPITIISPWGPMNGDETCWLASTADLDTNEIETPGKVYLIHGKSFEETYKPLE